MLSDDVWYAPWYAIPLSIFSYLTIQISFFTFALYSTRKTRGNIYNNMNIDIPQGKVIHVLNNYICKDGINMVLEYHGSENIHEHYVTIHEYAYSVLSQPSSNMGYQYSYTYVMEDCLKPFKNTLYNSININVNDPTFDNYDFLIAAKYYQLRLYKQIFQTIVMIMSIILIIIESINDTDPHYNAWYTLQKIILRFLNITVFFRYMVPLFQQPICQLFLHGPHNRNVICLSILKLYQFVSMIFFTYLLAIYAMPSSILWMFPTAATFATVFYCISNFMVYVIKKSFRLLKNRLSRDTRHPTESVFNRIMVVIIDDVSIMFMIQAAVILSCYAVFLYNGGNWFWDCLVQDYNLRSSYQFMKWYHIVYFLNYI